MKKTIITTAICYIIFEVMFYFAIAFYFLKISPNYWTEDARSGFSTVSICALIIVGVIIFSLNHKK